jgi:AcrR family transcriptional regulator
MVRSQLKAKPPGDPVAIPPARTRGRRPGGAPPGRDALLRVAMIKFASSGYEATSLRDLASDAEVDVALVSRLFGPKLKLWEAVVEELVARQSVHLPKVQATAQAAMHDPRAAMTQLIVQFAQISHEIPAFPAFLLHELHRPGERLDLLLTRLVRPFQNACAPVLEAAMAEGVIGARNIDLFFFMLISAVSVPMASPRMLNRNFKSASTLRDEIAREACAMVLMPLRQPDPADGE